MSQIDQLKNAPTLREIMSPEGVEEKVKRETTFRITETQGAKFRIYVKEGNNLKAVSVVDDMAKALQEMGRVMMLMGAMLDNPEATIEILIQSARKKNRGTGNG